MRKKLSMLLCLLLCIGSVIAQEKTVSGIVLSAEDGEPIIGATVVAKSATVSGTVTDFNGNFSLKVSNDVKEIEVSFVGMTSQSVAAGQNLKITLHSDAELLDEVVVTAMGISRDKKALGYAAQDLKAEDLSQAASPSLASALQGKVSGVEIVPSSGMPGASSKITIRGSRSFTGDNTPLYVIDGMPVSSATDMDTGYSVTGSDYANRAVDIDPSDIESINILKGQAASALYGMRASNGVIIITTKSGKGVDKGKTQVTINSNLSIERISTSPDIQTEYAQGYGGEYSPYSSLAWGPKISELANDATYGGNVANAYTNAYGMHEGMYYVPQRAAAGLDPWATPQAYDNINGFFGTGSTWSNSVNVARGYEGGNMSISLGNTLSEGIIPNTGMERYNAKIAATSKLSEKWSAGFNGNFVKSTIDKQASGNDGVVATVYGAPSSYDLVGIPSSVEGDPYTQNNYRSGIFDAAFWATENNKFTEDTQRFFGNAYTQYSTNFGTSNHTLDAKYQIGVDSYSTTYSNMFGYGHVGGSEISNEVYAVTELNSLATLNYTWNINSDLEFNALVGNEFINKSISDTYSYGMNFNFAGWNHMSNASVYAASEAYYQQRTVGTFANVALAYRDMLYFNATCRNDIVSTMPRGSRSFTYPSVSLGFIFTELDALENDVLTFGKVRASYAEVGQAGVYYDSYYSTPVYGGGFSSGTPIMYPINSVVAYTPSSTVYDPDLRPQNTQSYEIGADLTFFKGVVSVNYTYSRQNVIDQIFEVPMASSTGYSSLVTNGGSIHTNAHEVTLGIVPIQTKDFRWDMEFNFSKVDNYVDELAEGVESIMLGGFVDPQVRAGIGDEFPVIYGTSYLRNDDGQIVVDENGLPQAGAEAVIGTAAADFRLGFNTSFEYKKFRLSAVFDWKQGGQMYCGTSNVLDYYGVSQRSADYRNMESFLFEEPAVKEVVAADGSITYAPNDIEISGEDAFAYFDRLSGISEAAICDNSYIKLREVALSFPVYSKANKLDISGNIFARNILVWTTLEGGLDPEASQGNNNMAGCFERFSLPATSSYGLGLTVKF